MMSLKQRISKKLIVLILVCFFIDSIYAKSIVIKVGGGGADNLKFVPQNVTANKGDTILWEFMGGNHNVFETTGHPGSCEAKQSDNFQSLTNPPDNKFSIVINQEKAVVTYMCSYNLHCQNGMWGIIYVGGTEPPSFPKPTPTNNDATSSPQTDEDNSTGKIVGIVIGSVASFLIVSISGYLLSRRCKCKSGKTAPTLGKMENSVKATENIDQETKYQAKIEDV